MEILSVKSGIVATRYNHTYILLHIYKKDMHL